jgi:AcrR family transcriptional regulator
LTLNCGLTIVFLVLRLLETEGSGSSVVKLSLRERNRERVRTAIVDSALELFSSRGFDDASVAEVADRAGVSAATVARYFPTKESILFSDQAANVARLRADILGRSPSESPLEALIGALLSQPEMPPAALRRLLRSRQAIARSSVLGGRALDLLRSWRDGLADALFERGGLAELDARSISTAVVALLDDAAARWADGDGTTELGEEVRSSLSALERARRPIRWTTNL